MSTTSERAVELYKSAREQQTKFTYFMMGLAAASIAFAVQTTKDARLSDDHYVLGFAVICWLASLFSGFRYVERGMAANFINHEYLQFRVQIANRQIEDGMAAAEIMKKLEKATRDAAEKVGIWHTLQTCSLYLGTMVFVVWHVLRMANTR